MTPEAKVKKEVRKILDAHGAYYTMPVTGGYGRSGAPDFLICYQGLFIGVECKAEEGMPMSGLQERAAEQIVAAGGKFLLVHRDNLPLLVQLLQNPRKYDG